MDVTEFIERKEPWGKAQASSLEPYCRQIMNLKSKGYSDEQIRLFLSENDLRVTRPTISRFVAKQRLKAEPASENSSGKERSDDQTSQILIKPVIENKKVNGSISLPKTKLSLGDHLIDKPPAKATISEILSEMDSLDATQ